MTDTTKPNGDRDRPSDRETAKNPRGPAMGPPEGPASSGSTSPPLDMALLRELAAEFGFWPATTDPDDIERHRRHSVEAWAERHRLEGHHPHPAPTKENPEQWECKCDPDAVWTAVWRIPTPEQVRQKFAHLGAAAKARREGRPLPWDDPAWQEEIRQAKQRVAEWEQTKK